MIKVGVFVNHDVDEITAIVDQVKLDCVQLHGDEMPETLSALPQNVRVVRAHRCSAQGLSDLARYLNKCQSRGRVPDAVLIDADANGEFGGTGRVADWARITNDRDALGGIPLILAGGLTPDNVRHAIAAVRPDGVDVASGVEKNPAAKDHELIARFVDSARQAFAVSSQCRDA